MIRPRDNVLQTLLGIVCLNGIGVEFGATVSDKPFGGAKFRNNLGANEAGDGSGLRLLVAQAMASGLHSQSP